MELGECLKVASMYCLDDCQPNLKLLPTNMLIPVNDAMTRVFSLDVTIPILEYMRIEWT